MASFNNWESMNTLRNIMNTNHAMREANTSKVTNFIKNFRLSIINLKRFTRAQPEKAPILQTLLHLQMKQVTKIKNFSYLLHKKNMLPLRL